MTEIIVGIAYSKYESRKYNKALKLSEKIEKAYTDKEK